MPLDILDITLMTLGLDNAFVGGLSVIHNDKTSTGPDG